MVFAAGLVGYNTGEVIECYATGSVSGDCEACGGLVGGNVGSVICSFATGPVGGIAGGLAGSNTGTITQCFATGDVSGCTLFGAGGFVFENYGALIHCFATGNVSGIRFVGGLIALNRTSGTVTQCYATGRVSGSEDVGGLLGQSLSDFSPAVSYWDVESSGQSSSAGGDGKTTAEMTLRATFDGWDFDGVWDIVDGITYPFLRDVGPPVAGAHTGDQDDDGRIGVVELLRVVQFYNSGGLHCAANPADTEDGYVPGPGADHSCGTHASDYDGGADWVISLSELLRLVQFYNSGGYHACPGDDTEDGYCPDSR